jgi:hypothetical protein
MCDVGVSSCFKGQGEQILMIKMVTKKMLTKIITENKKEKL